MCSVPVGPFCCLYSGRVCIYVLYMCVCVCFFHLCKCLCSNHGSGCVSWRRRKASFEVGPVKWAPGSCAWSWPAKITEKEIIIYTEVNVFDLFTRIYLVWQTNYCDLANNSYNTTKLCIFPFSEGLLRNKMKMFEMLREWIDSNLLPLAEMFDGTTVVEIGCKQRRKWTELLHGKFTLSVLGINACSLRYQRIFKRP